MFSEEGRQKRRERFEEQVSSHLKALYSTAFRLTRDHHDAEDLLQETCLKAYQKFAQLKDLARARGWLLRILIRTFFNAYHRQQREPEALPYADETHGHAGETPETVVFGRLLDDEISAALDALPAEYRLAVILADIEGLSYQEIAEGLGCPVGTVRSRLSRGRRRLAELLGVVARERGYLKERRGEQE